MGILKYIADSVANRGALHLVGSKDDESTANTRFLADTKPITQAYTPQSRNIVAQEFAEQTMTALPRTPQELAIGEMGPPLPNPQTYRDPAAATRAYYDRLVDQERARETARAKEQLSDPMFRFRDTVTDVARNTIGLPFHIMSGGQAFNNDPSREVQSRHEQRLKELDKINGANSELYDKAKDSRFIALENLSNQRYVADTNRLNARTSSGNSARDSLLAGVAKVNPTYYTSESFNDWYETVQAGEPNFDLLKFKKNIELRENKISGLTEVFDVGPDGGDNRKLGTIEDIAGDSDAGQVVEIRQSFIADQKTYFSERGSYRRKISAWNDKTEEMSNLISRARDSMAKGGAGLTGNAFKDMWFTEGKRLNNLLGVMKSRIGFDTLQAMRTDPDNKTGGALGQVAVQELEALQNSIDALDQATSMQELEIALENVEERYQLLGERLDGAMLDMDIRYGAGSSNARSFSDHIQSGDSKLKRFFDQSALEDPTEKVNNVSDKLFGPDGATSEGQNNNLQPGYNF